MFLKTAWPPLVTRDLAGVSPPVLPPLMIRQRASILKYAVHSAKPRPRAGTNTTAPPMQFDHVVIRT